MTLSINSQDSLTLLAWLRRSREDLGLSMRALGDRLGVPHSFVQKVESGERRLDVVEYVWYCEALGVEPSTGLALLSRTIKPSPQCFPSI